MQMVTHLRGRLTDHRIPGPGKGNWGKPRKILFSRASLMTAIVRPPKEERDRKAAEKKAYIARGANNGSDDDAEGEEE